MSVKQISVIISNQKGSLTDITKSLAEADVDLRSLTLADSEDFGIIRLIVSDIDHAVKALTDQGYAPRIKELAAFAVPDVPGGLSYPLQILSDHDINVEYMYAITTREVGLAYTVIRVDDHEAVEELLKNSGVRVLSEEDI